MIWARQRGPAGSRTLALGFLLAALVTVGFSLAARPAHAATTFTVNTTNDLGDVNPGDGVCDVNNIPGIEACTLRAAIQEANATRGADAIHFDIGGGSGVKTVSPATELPELTDPVTIDGYTQDGASENTLEQGTNAVLKIELDGSAAAEGADGLEIEANNTTIRGLAINDFDFGIQVSSSNNVIEGNFVGTDDAGTADQGNGSTGVIVFSGKKNTIGGTAPAARNLISGNGGFGVVVNASANAIQGNLIGTDKTGANDLGNDLSGVSVFSSARNTVSGNTVAFNAEDGVQLAGRGTAGNPILGNSIFSNGDLGIDLDANGRTLNDPRDRDKGANKGQNFPVLTSVTTSGGTTTITGTLDSAPDKKFTIQFFSNPPDSPDEGKKFIGELAGEQGVKTDRSGQASFTFSPEAEVPAGQLVTATATDAKGNTSEFSNFRGVAS